MFDQLTSPDTWHKKSHDYIVAARGCKKTLTNPKGHWRLPADSEQVRDAVAFWVRKARDAHAVAMGRAPVLSNLFVWMDGYTHQGPLFVNKQAN